MSSTYKQLFRGRVVVANPFHSALLAWPSPSPQRQTPAVGDNDVRAMLAIALDDSDTWRGHRDHAIIALLWHTGLRRSSVASVSIENIRREGDQTLLRARIKGGALRDVMLVEEAENAVSAWLKVAGITSGALFPASAGTSEPISGDAVYRVLQLRARQAGAVGHVTPHQLRAALATAGYDAGLPEYEVQAALHHARPETTRRYDRGQRGVRALQAVAAIRAQAK